MVTPVSILMYHSVGTTANAAYERWVVSPERFARHMAFLAGYGCQPMTVSAFAEALAARRALPPRTVLITFDDGLRDFLTGAMPVLQRHGFPATLFVASGYVGSTARWLGTLGEGERPMLGWNELREIAAVGIECGAHTHSHAQLDILPVSAAAEEIRLSKTILEDQLGRAVRSFAYPHGYASRTTRRLVREAGFAAACRVRHALSSTDEERFGLSRIIMTGDVEERDLAEWLAGRGLAVAPAADRLVARGWRLARLVRRLSSYAIDPRGLPRPAANAIGKY